MDYTSTILDASYWLTIEKMPIKSFVWFLTNFLSAIAYISIPLYLNEWKRMLNTPLADSLINMFASFILFCGLSHISMPLIMATAPWWFIILVMVPMTFVAVSTAVLLHQYKSRLHTIMVYLAERIEKDTAHDLDSK